MLSDDFVSVFFVKNACIFACGFQLNRKTSPCIFFRWFALRFREITYAKILRFTAVSFGDLLLHEKQKKSFVSLNNEISEASL